MRKFLPALFVAVFGLITTPALAHTGHGADGLAAGLAHPFNGLDHLLVMVGVGLWAAQLGGRNAWLVPLAFVATMAAGAGLSLAGLPLPQVELGIAGSVIVIGLLVGLSAQLPSGMAAAIVALLALFHGHAHGGEVPEAVSVWGYAAGFVLSTGLLHGIGLGLFGLARPVCVRAAGFLTVILGGALLAGV